MKCSQVRNRLLAVSHPRKAPDEAREHVRACTKCQAWLKGVMQVDAAVRQLPVASPPQGRKAELLQQFRSPLVETVPESPVLAGVATEPLAVPSLSRRSRERFWSRFGMGVAIAASVLAVVVWLGNQAGSSSQPSVLVAKPVDQLLATLLERHVALAAKANSPIDRLDSLTKLATDLRTESVELSLIATPEDMDALARMYAKVIEKGVLPQASQVRGPQQKAILESVRKQLEEAGETVARKAETTTRGSMEPLRQIAEASRKGDQHIRMLLKEGAS